MVSLQLCLLVGVEDDARLPQSLQDMLRGIAVQDMVPSWCQGYRFSLQLLRVGLRLITKLFSLSMASCTALSSSSNML